MPAAVEHALAAGPPARPPGPVERLDRRAPREPEYPLGPELEDRVTAPDQLVLYRGRVRVDDEGCPRWRRRWRAAKMSLTLACPAYEVERGGEGRTVEVGPDGRYPRQPVAETTPPRPQKQQQEQEQEQEPE